MPFFKPSSQKRLKKYLKHHGFEIIEGGNHTKAVKDSVTLVFPRSNHVSPGVTRSICNQLVELGHDSKVIEKEILS